MGTNTNTDCDADSMNENFWLVLVLMFVLGFLYNKLIEYAQKQLPNHHGLTSVMVIGGCCIYLFGQFLLTDAATTTVSLLLFMALGSSLIVGSVVRFLDGK